MLKLPFTIAFVLWSITGSMPSAHALYDFNATVDKVAGPYGIGATDFAGVIDAVLSALVPLVYAIAILIVLRAAILLIVEQSQNELTQFKTAIVGSLIAVVIVSIAKELSDALFVDVGTIPSDTAALGIETEFLGIVDFIEEPLAVVAILMIIISGIRTVLAWGGSEGLTHLKRTIISILIGFALILAKTAIKESIVEDYTPNKIIQTVVDYAKIFLGFVTLAAVAVIIYAGFLMIANVGKDEQYQRAKGIIIRVAIGLIVILVSVALASVFLV